MILYTTRLRLMLVVALLTMTAIYYIVPWTQLGLGWELVGVAFLVLYLQVIPGVILRRWLGIRTYDAIMAFTTSFVLGLAYFLLLAFVVALTGISLETFQRLLPVAVFPPALLVWYAGSAGDAQIRQPPSRGQLAWTGTFIALLITIFVLTLRSGAPVDYTKDTVDHVAYVSEIRQTGEAFPRTEFYIEDSDNGRDIRKGLLHYYYGYAGNYLGIDLMRSIDIINAILAVVMLMAIYSLALYVSNKQSVAVLSVVIFLLSAGGGLGGNLIRLSFYPNRFGTVFFFFVLIYGLRYLDKFRKRDLAVAAFFAFAASATHIFYSIIVIAAGLVIMFWKVCFPQYPAREHLRRVMVLGFGVMVGILPYAIYRYLTAWPQANELHAEVQGVVFLTNRLFVANPIEFLRWYGPVGLLSFLTVPFLWNQRRLRPGLGYVIASLLTVPLVWFNPILVPLLHSVITYLILRLNVISPFYILPALFLVTTFVKWRSGSRSSIASYVLTGLLLIALAVQLKPILGANTFSPSVIQREHARSYERWRGGLDFLNEKTPPVVVASDPMTSYSVTAFTPHYVVCTLDQHAPPNDMRLEERIIAARDILSPYVSMAHTTELLDLHRATHVVLNRRVHDDLILHYWSMDAEIYQQALTKFEQRPELFRRVHDQDGFVVFLWTGERASDEETEHNPYFLSSITEDFVPLQELAGEATLQAFRLGASEVDLGGRLKLDLVWSTKRTLRPNNYVVSVRLDHAATLLPIDGKPFPKISRKIKERMLGRRYRFRSDHKISNGFLSPDTWPLGQLVLDRSEIAIPFDAAPGTYDVHVKLLVAPRAPKYHIRDLLYDDDWFQGVRVGQVLIR